jgi:hypothetical protein
MDEYIHDTGQTLNVASSWVTFFLPCSASKDGVASILSGDTACITLLRYDCSFRYHSKESDLV